MRVVSLLKTPFKFPASLRERERERERGAAALCPFHVFYKQLYSDEEVQDKDWRKVLLTTPEHVSVLKHFVVPQESYVKNWLFSSFWKKDLREREEKRPLTNTRFTWVFSSFACIYGVDSIHNLWKRVKLINATLAELAAPFQASPPPSLICYQNLKSWWALRTSASERGFHR